MATAASAVTTAEYKAFQKNSALICDMVTNCADVGWFAIKLSEEDFIDARARSNIMGTVGEGPTDKCWKLLRAVETQIQVDSKKFRVLIAILEGSVVLHSAVTVIQRSYESFLLGNQSSIHDEPGAITESPVSEEAIPISEFNRQFALLITDLVELIQKEDGALERMQTTLEHLNMNRFMCVIFSEEYMNVISVRGFFKVLAGKLTAADCYNNLLLTLIQASRSKMALRRLEDFLENAERLAPFGEQNTEQKPQARISTGSFPFEIATETPPSLPSSGSPNEELVEVVCTQPQDRATEVQANIDATTMRLKAYERITMLLCGILRLPRWAMSYAKSRDGSITIVWHIPSGLHSHVLSNAGKITQHHLKLLAEEKIVHVSIAVCGQPPEVTWRPLDAPEPEHSGSTVAPSSLSLVDKSQGAQESDQKSDDCESPKPVKNGLQLMLKEMKDVEIMRAQFPYAWAPVTVSPNPSVFDRWIEICEEERTDDHIFCYCLYSSSDLASEIDRCEQSQAVAMVVINSENSYRIDPEHLTRTQKSSYPVLVVTQDDGKKLIHQLQRYKQGSGFIGRIKEDKGLPSVSENSPDEDAMPLMLTKELQSLLLLPGCKVKCVSQDEKLFQKLMHKFHAYEMQIKDGTLTDSTDGRRALDLLMENVVRNEEALTKDFPFCLGILWRVFVNQTEATVKKTAAYGRTQFVTECCNKVEQLDHQRINETLDVFLSRNFFVEAPTPVTAVFELLESACRTVLNLHCNTGSIRAKKDADKDIPQKFIYTAMFWTTLALKAYTAQQHDHYHQDDKGYWTRYFLEKPNLISLTDDGVEYVRHGMQLGEDFALPVQVCFGAKHLTKLLASDKKIHRFSVLSEAVVKLTPFVQLQDDIIMLLKSILDSHLYHAVYKSDDYCYSTCPTRGKPGTIEDGLVFLDSLLQMWKERHWNEEDIEEICQNWLSLLLDLIKLKEQGADQLLLEFFAPKAQVVEKHHKFLKEKLEKEMMSFRIQFFSPIYQALSDRLWKEPKLLFVASYLEKYDFKYHKDAVISGELETWKTFLYTVVQRYPGIAHHSAIERFLIRVEGNYRKRNISNRFLTDLMILTVPGLFEGKDAQTFPKLFADHIETVGPPQSLKEILDALKMPQLSQLQYLVWRAIIVGIIPNSHALKGVKECTSKHAKHAIDTAASVLCQEPQRWSTHKDLCWVIIGRCCEKMTILESENVGALTRLAAFDYAISKIGEVYEQYAQCEIPETLRKHHAYLSYVKWIQVLRTVLEKWKKRFDKQDVTHDDIDVYLEQYQKVLHVAFRFGNMDLLVNEQTAKGAQKKYCHEFEELTKYLLPHVPIPTAAKKWCLLHTLLSNHRFSLTEEVKESIRMLVVFPNSRSDGDMRDIQTTLVSVADQFFLGRWQCKLLLTKEATLFKLDFLLTQISKELGLVIGGSHWELLVGTCSSVMLSQYLEAAKHNPSVRHYSQDSPKKLLEFALQRTAATVQMLEQSAIKYNELTAGGKIDLNDLDFNHEFEILKYVCEARHKSSNSIDLSAVKNMLNLFQLSKHINQIYQTCHQFSLHKCINSPDLRELRIIAEKADESNRANLTLSVANADYDKARKKLQLKGEQSHKCLDLFSKVAECRQFHQFILDKFSTSSDSPLSEKQLQQVPGQFHQLFRIAADLLQDSDFAQDVLSHSQIAFQYLLIFLNTNMSFGSLMSEVTKLGDTQDFDELTTANTYVDYLKEWYSLTEGDVWKSVSRQLQLILKTGHYRFHHSQGFMLKSAISLTYSTGSHHVQWYDEQIVDFVHKVGLVDTTADGQVAINCFLQLNEIAYKLLEVNTKLRELGHSESDKIVSELPCSTLISKAQDQTRPTDGDHLPSYLDILVPEVYKVLHVKSRVYQATKGSKRACNTVCVNSKIQTWRLLSSAEETLDKWRKTVQSLRQNNTWLLFFNTLQLLELEGNLRAKCHSKVVQSVSFLLKNTPHSRMTLQRHITKLPGAEMPTGTAMEDVGCFLTHLFQEQLCDTDLLIPTPGPIHTQAAFVHICRGYVQSQLVRLIIEEFQGIPQPFCLLHCNPHTTEEDLGVFMERATKYPNQYMILKVNNLSYYLQEILLKLYSDSARERQMPSTIHFVETSQSLFSEVPWIQPKDHEKLSAFQEARTLCEKRMLDIKLYSSLQLIYGYPGIGKTYYIYQQLKHIPAERKTTIAVNEAFQRFNVIQKLKELPMAKDCAIYFSFTMAPPGGKVSENEVQRYHQHMDDIGWFFFELLVLGYVQDVSTGATFHFPGGLGWKVYVEVSSHSRKSIHPKETPEDILKTFKEEEIPALSLVGESHRIDPTTTPYCIDDDVRLVCGYLNAHKTGEINMLYIEGILGIKGPIDIGPNLSERACEVNLKLYGIPRTKDLPIVQMILEARKKRKLDKIYVTGERISFKPGDRGRPTLSDAKCHKLLSSALSTLPGNVRENKIIQKLFIRYMIRRCKFLEQMPGFYFNHGVDVQLRGHGQLPNTVLLGSLLMETMLREVRELCDPYGNHDWTKKSHQQLIYDMKDSGGTFGLLALNPQDVTESATIDLYKRLGIVVPTASEMRRREFLDNILSRALSVPLNEKSRLQEIDETDYVLTLDYALKMLNIHERFECGIPVIIEGETGVGKTALVQMLSRLWNASLAAEWKRKMSHITHQLEYFLKTRYGEFIKAVEALAAAYRMPEESDVASPQQVQLLTSEGVMPEEKLFQETAYSMAFGSLHELLMELKCNPVLPYLKLKKQSSESCSHPDDLRFILKLFEDAHEHPQNLKLTCKLFSVLHSAKVKTRVKKCNVHSALKPEEVKSFFRKVIHRANKLQEFAEEQAISESDSTNFKQSPPSITAYLDEVNTSSCLGLFKEIIVDRTLDGEPIPDNIFIIASCNPHRGDSLAPRSKSTAKAHLAYYVRELHPTLQLLKWDYGYLDKVRESDYISEKLELFRKEAKYMAQDLFNVSQLDCLTTLISKSQIEMRRYAQQQLRRNAELSEHDVQVQSNSCVSQRDILRVFTFCKWLVKTHRKFKRCLGEESCYRAILVALGLVYYLRLDTVHRTSYEQLLNNYAPSCGSPVTFTTAFNDELKWYTDRVKLPPGIAKTTALKENLFTIIISTATQTPLIIEGPPGCSKTLSFNIAVANLKGQQSQTNEFQITGIFPALDPYFYQCSRCTTSNEISMVFERAIRAQQDHISIYVRSQTRAMKAQFGHVEIHPQTYSVVFMDEAGLPEEELESLKALHYHLDNPKVSFVAITNDPLDAAKTNRAVNLYRPEASDADLEDLAKDCLIQADVDEVKALCSAYKSVVRKKDSELLEFFGLRDFMYFLIHLQREQGDVTPQRIIEALERNFNGRDDFQHICHEFLKVFQQTETPEVHYRRMVDILKNALSDQSYTHVHGHPMSIQSESRYKLIIDPSEDDSLVRLLFTFGVLDRSKTKLQVCSNFPGDKHFMARTIAEIRHSSSRGDTMLLCQTDKIQDSFYDLFNRHFHCIKNPGNKDGVLLYANIALGAHSKPCRIDPAFQCVVVVKESEIQQKKITPAFLNRFEKYKLSHRSLWEEALTRLPHNLGILLGVVHHKANEFVKNFTCFSFYGLHEATTVDSLMITLLQHFIASAETVDHSASAITASDPVGVSSFKPVQMGYLLETLLDSLRKQGYLRIPVLPEEELQLDAESIFELVAEEEEFRDVLSRNDLFDDSDIDTALRILGVNSDFEEGSKFVHRKSCAVIAVLLQWLIRYVCKRLMQVMTPEALTVHNERMPRSYIKSYLEFQHHFSLKGLIRRHIQRIRETSPSEKLICFTRSSAATDELPNEYQPNSKQDRVATVKAILCEDPKQVMIYRLHSGTSYNKLKTLLETFTNSVKFKAFLLIAEFPEINKGVVNHLRIMIEEEERRAGSTSKLYVVLLLFPPVMFFNACYPTLFLEGWDHYYLDTLTSTREHVIDVKQWFECCCLLPSTPHPASDPTTRDSVVEKSDSELKSLFSEAICVEPLVEEAIPVICSRVPFGFKPNAYFNREMRASERSRVLSELFGSKGLGKVLCELFRSRWNPRHMIHYVKRAASYAYDHAFSLSLTDSVQTMVKSLFFDFMLYMISRMNEDCNIDTLFTNQCEAVHSLFISILHTLPIPELSNIPAAIAFLVPPCSSKNFEFPFFKFTFELLEKLTVNCTMAVAHDHISVPDQGKVAVNVQKVCSLAKSDESHLEDEERCCLEAIIAEIDRDDKNKDSHKLWAKYLKDFLHFRLLSGSDTEGVILKILEKYFEPLQEEADILVRLVALHAHVYLFQLDRAPVITVLSVISKSLAVAPGTQPSVSPSLEQKVLTSVHSLHIPQKQILGDRFQYLAAYIICTMYSSLQTIFQSAQPTPQPQTQALGAWCSSYLLIVSSSPVKQSIYCSLPDLQKEERAKLSIMHATFLVRQCTHDWDDCYRMFTSLSSIYFSDAQTMELKSSPLLVELALIGAPILGKGTASAQKGKLGQFLEGLLDHFYPEYGVQWYLEYDWFLALANQQYTMPQITKESLTTAGVQFSEPSVFHEMVSLNVYKFFLSRILWTDSKKTSEGLLGVMYYKKEIRSAVGRRLMSRPHLGSPGEYVPFFYQHKYVKSIEGFSRGTVISTMNQPLTHLYFILLMEEMQLKRPADLDLRILASHASKILKKLPTVSDKPESVLLYIEKQALTQMIAKEFAQDAAENIKMLSGRYSLKIITELLNDERAGKGHALVLSLPLLKSTCVQDDLIQLLNSSNDLNREFSCLTSIHSLFPEWNPQSPQKALDAERLLKYLRMLQAHYPLPSEEDLQQAKPPHLLSRFIQERPRLELGSTLLPKLIQFYQWLHRYVALTVTLQDAGRKSITDVIDELVDEHRDQRGGFLYEKFYDDFNKYVQSYVGADLQISEDTKLLQFVSTAEDIGLVFAVIKDIVSHQNMFLHEMESFIMENQSLKRHFSKPVVIKPAKVNEQSCIMPSQASEEQGTSSFIQLMWRRCQFPEIHQFDLPALQQDIVATYLTGKYIISNLEELFTYFKFSKRIQLDKPPDHLANDLQSIKEKLPQEFQQPLMEDNLKHLELAFHSADYDTVQDVEWGLGNCAHYIIQVLGPDPDAARKKEFLDITLSSFICKWVCQKTSQPITGHCKIFKEVGISRLPEYRLQQSCLPNLKLQFVCGALNQFVEWIQKGFYEFRELPFQLKKRLNQEHESEIKSLCEKEATKEALKRFEQDGLLKLEADLRDENLQKPIMLCLKERHLIQDGDATLLQKLGYMVFVEHYVHLRMVLRRYLHDVNRVAPSKKPAWDEAVKDLWKSESLLQNLLKDSYVPTGEFEFDPRTRKFGFQDGYEDEYVKEEPQQSEEGMRIVTESTQLQSGATVLAGVSLAQATLSVTDTYPGTQLQSGATGGVSPEDIEYMEWAQSCSEEDVDEYLKSIKLDKFREKFREDVDGELLLSLIDERNKKAFTDMGLDALQTAKVMRKKGGFRQFLKKKFMKGK